MKHDPYPVFDIHNEWDTKENILRTWYSSKNDMTYFCLYKYVDDPFTLYLSNLYVDEDCRGLGIGNRILNFAASYAKINGAKRIRLWAEKDSMPYKWYKRHLYFDMAKEYEGKPNNVWMQFDIPPEV